MEKLLNTCTVAKLSRILHKSTFYSQIGKCYTGHLYSAKSYTNCSVRPQLLDRVFTLREPVTCVRNTTRRVSLHAPKVGRKLLPCSRHARLWQQEIRAFTSLLTRSGFRTADDLARLCTGSSRSFSTSQYVRQQNQQDDPDKDQQPDDEKAPFLARLMLMFWLMFLLYVILRLQAGEESSMYKFVSWNEFYHDMLAKGEVEEIVVRPEMEMAFIKLHAGAIIKGNKMDSEMFTLKIVDPYKFEDKIRKAEQELDIRPERGIPISYQRENSWVHLVFLAVVGLAFFLIFKSMVKVQLPNPTDLFSNVRKAKFVRVDHQQLQGKGVTFRDVAGLHEAKIEVMEFVDYLKKPDRFKALGARIPKGALLLGPPGCGKTLLAKAVATESKVPFLAMAGSEFVEMLGGLGAARVRDLFKEAKQHAPCIIYIDEIDAIGRKRQGSGMQEGQSEEEHTLNQLLVEMDGMGSMEGVIMMASTNRSDILDKALLRPGRFDRHIIIDLPTLAERLEIFDIYLGRLKLAQTPSAYSQTLAQLSPGMSGADIGNICNEAALFAARHKKKVVDTADFDYAVERVLAGVAKKSRVLSPRETKVVAYHEAGHALVGWLLEHTDALLKVSIVPRASAALGFAQYMPSDKKLYSQQQLYERMCMAMGGRVAESLTFNSVTSGAQDDLKRVTRMAYDQIRLLGMNERVCPVSFPSQVDDSSIVGLKPYSKYLQAVMDQEVNGLIARAYKSTEKILQENKEKLKVVADALLEKETLTYKDMEELIGPPPFGRKHVIETDWGKPADKPPADTCTPPADTCKPPADTCKPPTDT